MPDHASPTVARLREDSTYYGGGPSQLFHLGRVDTDGDDTVGTMTTGPWCLAPSGAPAAGALGVFVDEAFGYGANRWRADGHWSVTTHCHITFHQRVPSDGSVLSARALTSPPVGRNAHGGGEITDPNGLPVATVSQWVRFFPTTDELTPRGLDEALPTALQPADLVRIVDETTIEVLPHRALTNPAGILHGGISMWACELAAAHLAATTGDRLAASLDVTFLAPLSAEHGASFTATPQHVGRGVASFEVLGRDHDGRVGVRATAMYHAP
ncbi:PaaI family thioesterase [Kribbia dieselivorans]|uniref:PaaI family thioesterase n=1 Tax=Kribbia dieselivorans TaxID=331526 RepID=UPI00147043C5|nr:hotdog domain-containing protein [Kribbia dieselivorans]